jgi:hypothetical protein
MADGAHRRETDACTPQVLLWSLIEGKAQAGLRAKTRLHAESLRRASKAFCSLPISLSFIT